MMTLKRAVEMCRAHGVPREAMEALETALESGTSARRMLPDLQRRGVAALLELYDGNRGAFAEWVAAEGAGEAIESARGLAQ